MTVGRRRFRRDRHGRYHPYLSPEERQLLAGLPAQALELIEHEDGATRRLFPAAYPDDEAADKEYRALMGESLRSRHRQALGALAEAATADDLSEADLNQWMGALEVLRLVLGTQLDVREDMDRIAPSDPLAPRFALYAWLSLLQEEVVEALADTLPSVDERDR
jgi:hypothetical protein